MLTLSDPPAGLNFRRALNTKQDSILCTVEIMNTATTQWSTAADLPRPLAFASAAVCDDQVYILGRSNMYTCSVTTLTQPRSSNIVGVWSQIAAPLVTQTTCVSIQGRLLVIGGRDSDREPTTAVHMYNPTTDSWEVISHMGTPRWQCITAVLPNNQLMVVGGCTGKEYNTETDSTELAAIELLP